MQAAERAAPPPPGYVQAPPAAPTPPPARSGRSLVCWSSAMARTLSGSAFSTAVVGTLKTAQ